MTKIPADASTLSRSQKSSSLPTSSRLQQRESDTLHGKILDSYLSGFESALFRLLWCQSDQSDYWGVAAAENTPVERATCRNMLLSHSLRFVPPHVETDAAGTDNCIGNRLQSSSCYRSLILLNPRGAKNIFNQH